eukprot:TRINITY_DN1489_c0_g1_i1.p2 TRINITY_DN1489_c0_g1~~TRINITY_DN1489_c0_g1_i1.p2  ORF type:complete len:227 (-),score=53.27 TRINITY_DN1489_c0_g1_i1:492-1172(-)
MRGWVLSTYADNMPRRRHGSAQLNHSVVSAVTDAARDWGARVMRYEITSVTPDQSISRAMDLQAAAERERRQTVKSAMAQKEATELMSEASRIRDENESMGVQARLINEAEGKRQQRLLEAEAEAAAIRMINEAKAESLRVIAASIRDSDAAPGAVGEDGKPTASGSGGEAARLQLAGQYLEWMGTMGRSAKGTHTVVVPQNMTDLSSLLSAGNAVMKGIPSGAPK